ncbi:MAG TPA: S8 family peptidase [Longimicrobiaceae bacterium]|nr:S8 family peptidase [Longimicrobiaceae bacterium]
MKLFSSPGLLALALVACAPAQTVAAPAPAPAAPQSPGVQQAAPALDTAPANWWLLDPATERFPGIGAERAYRELLAGKQPRKPVVVAILDTGVDVEHEDLDDNLWTNEDEVPGNGRDDDRNGYVDDVHGWNFIGGRDGRNVNQDTYELTRVYARLRARCADATGAPQPGRTGCERYAEVRAEFDSTVQERREQLEQIRSIDMIVDRATQVLRAHLGADSLTLEKVQAIQSFRPDVTQAKQIYLQLAAIRVTPEQIDEQRESLENDLRYGLDPSFDPRPIVGDDYANPVDRSYGNTDLEGPNADHGTHVAGIAAAERGNGGINGIASPVRIMAVRIVPDGDERDKDVANAIRYAVDNGAQVINMSFGKAYSPEKRLVDEAVRYADSRGVLLVHAAGNDGADLDRDPNFPTPIYEDGGRARNWIEVGASSWPAADSLAASFSNYSRTRVDVFAPGVDILSTVPGNRYERNQGTSMAAPVVTGIAALILAYYPELSADEVKQVILESATRYPDQRVLRPGSEGEQVRFGELSATGGVVNAYAALRLAEQRAAAKRR